MTRKKRFAIWKTLNADQRKMVVEMLKAMTRAVSQRVRDVAKEIDESISDELESTLNYEPEAEK